MTHLLQLLKNIVLSAHRTNALDFFPFIQSVREYRLKFLKDDLKSGINVALLAFPQGMAYALIAGLPIHYGIIGSAIASTFSIFFAKSNLITFGPTNATAVMLLTTFASLGLPEEDKLPYISVLVFLTGLFIVIGSYFRTADLIKYVSRSVITGYITAAALFIILNQIPNILQLNLTGINKDNFFNLIVGMFQNISLTHFPTLAMSLLTLLLYTLLNLKFRKLPNIAIVLIVISIFSYFINGKQYGIFFLPSIDQSFLSFSIPQISFGSIKLLTSTAIAIALLCILEGISIGKSLAIKKGVHLNNDQAMYSIGMTNIACSLFAGMPASGSLTRSSLNYESGSQTVFSNLFSGIIILIGIFTVGSFTQYIPICALSVLVVIVGLSLLNKHSIRIVTRTTGSDAIVFLATLFSGLYISLDSAIYFGVGISILLFLKKVAKPELKEYSFNQKGDLLEANNTDRDIPEVSIVHVEGELFFGAADLFQEQMRRIYEDPQLKIVILKMRNAHNMDASSVMALEELVKHMNKLGRYLILSEVKEGLLNVLNKSGVADYIEHRNIFLDNVSNPTISTAKALKRAREHLGEEEPHVSIYTESKNY
ncbi:MAG: SulP family inorganic anion transporter [Coraliomargaritaceae bacterium]